MQRSTAQDCTNPSQKGATGTTKIEKLLTYENSKFLADFDPEKSSREQRKSRKNQEIRVQSVSAKDDSIFDERGFYKHNNIDACDCLEEKCPGCFFPCPECSSTKCGPVCRVNRKWAFEKVEHDGKDKVIQRQLDILN